jgi:hypothetical protein
LREEGMGEGSCVLECDTADYVDSGANKCRHCMTQCATCLDGTSCTACATETNYLLVVNHLDGSGICTSTCPGIIDEDIMRCILDSNNSFIYKSIRYYTAKFTKKSVKIRLI